MFETQIFIQKSVISKQTSDDIAKLTVKDVLKTCKKTISNSITERYIFRKRQKNKQQRESKYRQISCKLNRMTDKYIEQANERSATGKTPPVRIKACFASADS